eukprot:3576438-Amphidinium_carterae.1
MEDIAQHLRLCTWKLIWRQAAKMLVMKVANLLVEVSPLSQTRGCPPIARVPRMGHARVLYSLPPPTCNAGKAKRRDSLF